MSEVTIQNEGRIIQVSPNTNLRKALLQAKVGLYSGMENIFNCHGAGMCGTCEVVVIKGAEHLTERTPREMRKLKTYDRCLRLSCQCAIIGDGNITLNTMCP